MIHELRAGDEVFDGQFVVGILDKGILLNTGVVLTDPETVEYFSRDNQGFRIEIDAFVQLADEGRMSPGVEKLETGMQLIWLNGITVRFVYVAVVDSQNKLAFDPNGEIIPVYSSGVLYTGWKINGENLLTEKGRQMMDKFYSI